MLKHYPQKTWALMCNDICALMGEKVISTAAIGDWARKFRDKDFDLTDFVLLKRQGQENSGVSDFSSRTIQGAVVFVRRCGPSYSEKYDTVVNTLNSHFKHIHNFTRDEIGVSF